MSEEQQQAVIDGNPSEGYRVIGPCTLEEADEVWHLVENPWIVTLTPPTDITKGD